MQNVQLANNRTNNNANYSKANPGDTARISLSELRRRRRARERKELTFKVMIVVAALFVLAMAILGGALLLDAQKHEQAADGLRFVDMNSMLAETGGKEFDAYRVDDKSIAKWRNGDYVIYCDLTNAEMHYYRSEPRFFGLLGEELTHAGGETNPGIGGEKVAIQGRDGRFAVATDCVNAMVRLNTKLAEEQA